MTEKGEIWVIWISGYGDFEFAGTEEEAEEMLKHKAAWERGKGMTYRKRNQRESDIITQQIVEAWEKNGDGVEQSLLSARAEALARERQCPPTPNNQKGEIK